MLTNNANHPIGLPLKNGKHIRLIPGDTTDADIDLENETVKQWLDLGILSKGRASKAKPSAPSEQQPPKQDAPGKPYSAVHQKFGDWIVVDKDNNPFKDVDDNEVVFRGKDGDAEAKAKAYANRLNLDN
jgi:hypothetical protein